MAYRPRVHPDYANNRLIYTTESSDDRRPDWEVERRLARRTAEKYPDLVIIGPTEREVDISKVDWSARAKQGDRLTPDERAAFLMDNPTCRSCSDTAVYVYWTKPKSGNDLSTCEYIPLCESHRPGAERQKVDWTARAKRPGRMTARERVAFLSDNPTCQRCSQPSVYVFWVAPVSRDDWSSCEYIPLCAGHSPLRQWGVQGPDKRPAKVF